VNIISAALPQQVAIYFAPLRPRPAAPVRRRAEVRSPPQREIQLVTKQHILGFKSPARLEQVGDDDCEGVQAHKHHCSWCSILPQHANPGLDGIFGKDKVEADFAARITSPGTGTPASIRKSAWMIFDCRPEDASKRWT
jgi:hypothetical protein